MKKIVFTFGRMNPPTIGHQKLVDKVNAVAKSNGADARVYLSHTSAQTDPKNKKDPLSYKEKIRFARKAFGNIVVQSQSKTIIQIAQELEKSGYTDLILVVGSDRVQEFKTLLNKYNGKDYNFDSIRVESAGERDPDAEGVEGMSASKLRSLAKAGDFDTFKTGLPKKLNDRDAKSIFDTINNVIKEEVDMEEERKPLTIQQRMARGRMLRRISHKLKIGRKRAAKRMANPEKLKKRAKKLAIAKIRTKVAGEKGRNYKELSPADKVTIDKLVLKRSAIVDKLAKRLLPTVRKSEKERLMKARSSKNEELDINFIFEATVAQDQDIKDREGTQPKKYFKDLSKSTKAKRDAAFQKGKEADDDDPNAYRPAPGDANAKTKPSKHTKKYHKMFGDKKEGVATDRAREAIKREKEQDKAKHDAMMDRARTQDTRTKNAQTEEYSLTESAESALRKKAEKSGIPYGTLKKVYDRGMAAWKTGHRPGATQQQWGFARVNSFITKGKGTWGGADKDLAKGVKKESVELDEARAKKAVAGGKVQKLITGFGMTYKGKKYDEIDFELVSIDNSSQIVTLKILHPREHIGDEVKVPFKTLRVGRFMATDTSKINEEVELDEKCWDGYKQVGMKKKGDKMVPDCVPETKEAVSPAQQAAIAISKKERGEAPKKELDEDWFTKLLNRYLIKPKTYKYAKEILRQVIDRKKKEGKLAHSIEYYAQQIAKQFSGVDARELAKMVTEEGGAGEQGTDKLANKYKKDTPMESCCEECEDHFNHIVEEVTIVEEDGKKKNVKLNDPFRTPSGPKKFSVYVKNDKGNVVKVNFGDPNMEIKRDDPNRRKSFRARHNCDDPGPKWKARYWSCYQWRSGSKVDN